MIVKLSALFFLFHLLSVNGILNSVDDAEKAKFQEWKSSFKRSYKSSGEENKAMRNLLNNRKEIEKHNLRFKVGLETYSRGLWELSDLSFEEKSKVLTGSTFNYTQLSLQGAPKKLKKAPPQVNWVSEGRVHPVQNQGRCGSCYVFAAVATAEGVLLKKGISTRLSVQQIVDCDKLDDGCDGLLSYDLN